MIALALALMLSATPQVRDAPVPPACIGATFVSWEACAEAAQEGTPTYSLAMINLGTEAYSRGDLTGALRFYDKAEIPGQAMTSDVVFHTLRGDARRYGGRMEEARADAAIAWGFLDGRPPPDTPADALGPFNDDLRALILSILLPILQDGDPGAFQKARAMYLALPATDWEALSRRAGALSEVGEYEAAVAASKGALDLQPTDPLTQNNHCYALVAAGRAAEGVTYCERAVAGRPEVAPMRHSYAAALAALGRCADAEAQMAEARRLDPAAALYREPLTCTPKG